jgi:excisionase family DNA binding protein
MNDRHAPIPPVLVTVEQACMALGVGRTHFYKLINADLLRPVRIGPKGVRVPVSELEALPGRLRDSEAA